MIDGSSWTGDGYARLRQLARLLEAGELAVFDFALVRQSRWREAIASTFDLPDFLPFLRSIRRIAVTYGTHDELGRPGTTNMVKPLYHVAWIASRLGMTVSRPLAALGPVGTAAASKPASQPSAASRSAGRHVGAKPVAGRGYSAMLRQGQADVAVVMRPVLSGMPAGTTLRVELLAERRGSELRVDVTAEAETVARPRLAGRGGAARPAVQRRPADGDRPAGRGDRGAASATSSRAPCGWRPGSSEPHEDPGPG